MVDDTSGKDGPPRKVRYFKRDAPIVMAEIATQIQFSTKAWVGYGEGRVVILKDDYRGFTTHYHYEEGVFVFLDGKGGEQRVNIEDITEIEGF